MLAARGMQRARLVGPSYGALVAVHFADRHPDRVLGVVSVDSAQPYGITGEESRERIRRPFRQARPLMPLLRPLGMSARMSTPPIRT